ncbi:hypothetical protein XELAEV_18035238mg [Xenopus laevis]|uniref:Uncharacterized protein n=1 Tax=Xenopus laevis TaxID=8355 RepID=A0A974CFV8_XENLA|nr:hypothetical protein XELAEV_18035238mg [Xenopus laevis]
MCVMQLGMGQVEQWFQILWVALTLWLLFTFNNNNLIYSLHSCVMLVHKELLLKHFGKKEVFHMLIPICQALSWAQYNGLHCGVNASLFITVCNAI